MKELNKCSIKEVSGGLWPVVLRVVLPTVINMAAYALNKKKNRQEITPTGLAIAGGSGVLTGGIGAAGSAAAGGGLIGSAVWAPGTIGMNASGNLIAQKY